MNPRNAVIGLVALGGIAAGALMMDGVESLAAPGDVVPTSPRTDTGLTLDRVCFDADGPHAQLVYRDGFGASRIAVVRNGTSHGFNYATGAPLNVATPSGFTDFRQAIGITNAKMTAAVDGLKTAGVIAVTGTVQ